MAFHQEIKHGDTDDAFKNFHFNLMSKCLLQSLIIIIIHYLSMIIFLLIVSAIIRSTLVININYIQSTNLTIHKLHITACTAAYEHVHHELRSPERTLVPQLLIENVSTHIFLSLPVHCALHTHFTRTS